MSSCPNLTIRTGAIAATSTALGATSQNYGVYPEVLVAPLAQLGFRGEVTYAQGDASTLKAYLDNGVPSLAYS